MRSILSKIKFEAVERIPYRDLLNTEEWKAKRQIIIQRDGYCCTKCGKTKSNNYAELLEQCTLLHVHHQYYIKNHLPWEYDDSALITLCNWCHWKLHESTKVAVYELVNGAYCDMNYDTCRKCHGVGHFPQYKHVEKGTCFRCRGQRYEQLIPENKNSKNGFTPDYLQSKVA
jgi:hypothetical protein